MKTPALFLALSLCFVSVAHADDKADLQKMVDEQTTIINGNPAETYLLAALANRSDAYLALNQRDKAKTDIERALSMIERHKEMVDYGPARFTLWKDKGAIAYLDHEYDEASKAFTEAARTSKWETFYDAVEFLLYRSQNHLTLHLTDDARAAVEQALRLCDPAEKGQLATARAMLSIALFEMGDMEGAVSNWNEAKKTATYLGDPPFEEDQIPFNHAVYENRASSKAAESILARANYFLTAAKNLEIERAKFQEKIYFVSDSNIPKIYGSGGFINLAYSQKSNVRLESHISGKEHFFFTADTDKTIYGSGGYSNLVRAKRANATPTTFADDALMDLKLVMSYNYSPAETVALRAKVRAYRWRLDDWDTSRKLDFKLSDIDADYNRAIEFKPFDLDVRVGRSEWLESRFNKLKSDAAGGAPLTPEEEAKTKLALSDAAIEDISRVLLKKPADTNLHSRRINLEAKRANLDLNTLLFDYNALIPLLKGTELTKATGLREKVQSGLVAFTPKTGTPLEWKNKGNALSQSQDYQGANDAYTKALLLDPKFTDALNNRATNYNLLGKFDLAMADLDAALALDPRHKAAYMSRSQVKLNVGDFDGAVADARKSLEVAPDEMWRKNSRENLAKMLKNRADSRSDSMTPEALLPVWTDLHEANALSPTFASLFNEGRAATYLRRGSDALAAFNKASAIKADDSDLLILKTIVLTALNDPQAAATEKLAMAFNNRSSDPYGRMDGIARDFAKGAPFNPANAVAEKERLTALQGRFWDAWYDSKGGLTLKGN